MTDYHVRRIEQATKKQKKRMKVISVKEEYKNVLYASL